jgi:hypothetical protein
MANPDRKELTQTDTSRGIQNATSRFKRQREGQLLSTQLLEGAKRERYSGVAANDSEYAANDPDYRGRSGRRLSLAQDESSLLAGELEELARTEGLEYEGGDEGFLVKNTPEKPSFPGLMVSLALLKDVLDGLEITGVGILVTTALSFLLALVLFLWMLDKLSGGWWKKKLVRKLFIKYGLAITIEFIPVLKLIPTATIFVLMAHYDETKIVRLLNGALERMRSGGIKGG